MALKTTNKNRKAGKKVEVIEEVKMVEKVEKGGSGASDLYSATDWIDEGFGADFGVDVRNKIMLGIGVICFVLFFFV